MMMFQIHTTLSCGQCARLFGGSDDTSQGADEDVSELHQKIRMTKRQEDKNAKRQKYKKTKRQIDQTKKYRHFKKTYQKENQIL